VHSHDFVFQNEIEQTSRDIREEKDEHWRRVGSLQDGRNGMVLFVYERHDNHFYISRKHIISLT
jgi:hypothetical protein